MATGFADLATEQLNSARAQFGERERVPELRLPVPATPARYAWNVSAWWLGKIAPLVDDLVETLPADRARDWRVARDRYIKLWVEIFRPAVLTGRINKFLADDTAELSSEFARRFWIETIKLGIAAEATLIVPDRGTLAFDSVAEAIDELPKNLPLFDWALVVAAIVGGVLLLKVTR